MKNTSIKLLILVIFAVCFYGFIKVSPVLEKGYEMYCIAVDVESIETKLDRLKQDESYMTIDKIPEEFKKQIVHSEDKRFYYHLGVDPIAIIRATIHNVKAGGFVQGGSTITQQLAKNLYFSFEKSWSEKLLNC